MQKDESSGTYLQGRKVGRTIRSSSLISPNIKKNLNHSKFDLA